MKKDVILSYDIGTTGCKASLYKINGDLLASKYSTYETFYPHENWVQQKPEDWWNSICDSTKKVLGQSNVGPKRVLGISFSGQMMSLIPMDKNGSILMDEVMIWADDRSKDEGKIIEKEIGWKNFYYRTGAGMPIPLYPAAKVLWIKRNYPEIYNKAYKFIGVKDIIIHRLTGGFLTDYSDASNTGLFSIGEKKWDQDILNALDLNIEKLPLILKSTDIAGKIQKDVSDEIGLPAGTPVVIGGGDVPSAALGAGVITPGNAYNCIGSASWLAIASDEPVFDDVMRPFTLCHVVPDTFVVQLAMFSAGVVYQWAKDQLCNYESLIAEKENKGVYYLMDKLAESSPAGASGLVFLPNMRPGGAPHNNLDDKGALLGLKLSQKKGDILRAILEGISLNIRIMAEAIEEKVNNYFECINLVGGGSKSPVWQQILASVLNKNINILAAQQEANSLGAMIVAGVGLGVFSSFGQAVKSFIHIQSVVKPKPEEEKTYEKVYEIFKQSYDALVLINSKLSNL
jgi:xylulokinase